MRTDVLSRQQIEHGCRRERGGALLVVLWLTAALSAIAFSVAGTVRGEIERTSTALDGTRAYYLATGAIERALLYMEWGPRYHLPDGSSRYYSPWTTALSFSFPAGVATVEIIPESAKLDVNNSRPDDLLRLLAALGADPPRAQEIVRAIVDWRTRPPDGGPSPFDQYYLSLVPSFHAPHASFEEIEELLLVKGMTAELFYGSFSRDRQGRLLSQVGLRDCLSVYGVTGRVDVNTAPAPVLAAVGLSPEAVTAVVQSRRTTPFRSMQQLDAISLAAGPAGNRVGIGGHSIFTLRATARLRLPDGKLSDLHRSVAATVRLLGAGMAQPYQVLRWRDWAWAQ
jgi:general secretion pathway protein K